MSDQYQGIVPYLFYDDAEAAMAWYTRVFGFEEIGRWSDDSGKIQNAEMRVGTTELWLDGGGKRHFDEHGNHGPVWIGVWVDDVDEMYRRVREAGVDAEEPVTRDFGVRMLTVEDPEGYQWGFMRRV